MADPSQNTDVRTLRESLGLVHLFRTLGLAVEPRTLLIALLGLWATLFYGGWLLDPLWHGLGAARVAPDAVDQFIVSTHTGQPYEEPAGDQGVFGVFREHQRRAVLRVTGWCFPGSWATTEIPGAAGRNTYASSRPLRDISEMVYGVWWLMRCHFAYFLLLMAGTLVIWSFCGGAICRLAAVKFARDRTITTPQAFTYAKDNLISGFLPAPCMPLAFIAITGLAMVLFGVLFRLPFVGDVLGGVAFVLPVLGGFIIAVLALGFLIGVGLFWPAVAAEGADWFDAFARGLSYPLSRPWKAAMYALVTFAFGFICWVFANLFTYTALSVSRGLVAWGTSPFGLWARGTDAAPISKMELLWPMAGPTAMYDWPDWSQLGFFERVAAALIGLCVLTVISLMWSFLASFFHCGATVIYFLLRRDVNGTDLQEVCVDEANLEPGGAWLSTGSAIPSKDAAPAATAAPIQITPPPSDGEPKA